jgi:hypothetical protein
VQKGPVAALFSSVTTIKRLRKKIHIKSVLVNTDNCIHVEWLICAACKVTPKKRKCCNFSRIRPLQKGENTDFDSQCLRNIKGLDLQTDPRTEHNGRFKNFFRLSSGGKKKGHVVRVTIDGFWIHWAVLQLVTILHISLSYIFQCSQVRCLAAASNNVASWPSVSNGSCPRWLAPSTCCSSAELTKSKPKSKLYYDRRSVGQPVLVSDLKIGSLHSPGEDPI